MMGHVDDLRSLSRGQLLAEIEPAPTGPKPELREGARPQLGRTAAAREAGEIKVRAERRTGELLRQEERQERKRTDLSGDQGEPQRTPLQTAKQEAGISDLTACQRAMAYALALPEPAKRGRGNKNVHAVDNLSKQYISRARCILPHPDLRADPAGKAAGEAEQPRSGGTTSIRRGVFDSDSPLRALP
jgi:hypothetical protein